MLSFGMEERTKKIATALGGFFCPEGIAAHLEELGYTAKEEINLLIDIIRNEEPKHQISAMKMLRKIIEDAATKASMRSYIMGSSPFPPGTDEPLVEKQILPGTQLPPPDETLSRFIDEHIQKPKDS